jgi:hypothetical protein
MRMIMVGYDAVSDYVAIFLGLLGVNRELIIA